MTRKPLADRLDRGLDKSGECWVWQGSLVGNGYGKIWDSKGRGIRAHRLAWELQNGPIPEGLCVLHDCDNPPCCNPAHLHLGTQADNMRECRERGRARNGRMPGEQNPNARLTQEQVDDIRARYAIGGIRQKSLAAEYGMSTQAVSDIIRRVRW